MKFAAATDYKNHGSVVKEYPEAVKIVTVCGGWMVFETMTEFETWKRQK